MASLAARYDASVLSSCLAGCVIRLPWQRLVGISITFSAPCVLLFCALANRLPAWTCQRLPIRRAPVRLPVPLAAAMLHCRTFHAVLAAIHVGCPLLSLNRASIAEPGRD